MVGALDWNGTVRFGSETVGFGSGTVGFGSGTVGFLVFFLSGFV